MNLHSLLQGIFLTQVPLRGEGCLQYRRPEFDPWVGKIPWRRKWLPTPVFLPGEFHGQRSLMGYGPWSCKEFSLPLGLALGSPIFPSGCEGKLGVALESLQGLRDLT